MILVNNIVCDFIDPKDLVLDTEELSKRLRTPNPMGDETIKNCTERILNTCKPRYCYVKTSVLANDKGCIFDFMTAESLSIRKALSGCGSAYVVAVTLGIETDRLITSLAVTSKAQSFIADAVASALAESAVQHVTNLLGENLAMRFSPGYGDFVLSYQQKILDYLKADKLLGIKLSSTYIMTPRKTVTALIGVNE